MVMAGKARMMRKDVISVIHVKTGRRIMLRPGARMLMMVVMKLNDPASEASPRICRPMIQKSVPMSGLNWRAVRGAYPNQPIAGAPPWKNQLRLMMIPPRRKVHKPSAFSLGKATSRAPICRGMM
jgi:hypothetical protein